MESDSAPEELIRHICSIAPVEPATAERLVREILHFYSDTVEDFIVKRHRELQSAGLSNARIYQCIEQELQLRRFQITPLTIRQIRRVIYG